MRSPLLQRSLLPAAGILVAGYAALLLHYNCGFAGGPDSSGYLSEARLIASGRMTYDLSPFHEKLGLPIDMSYTMTPLGFAPAPRGKAMVPTYPAGLPFHQALFAKVGGWTHAPYLVAPLLALLSFFATWGVARELGIGRAYAVAAGALVVTAPVLMDHAVQPVSDVVATFYALLSVWLALRARGAIRWALLAGVAFSVAVWVRPTNFLLLLPIVFALRGRVERLLAASVGALPLGLALAWWDRTLYGSALRTGYGSVRDVLARQPVCAGFHVTALSHMLTPVVVIASVYALFERRLDRWQRALLASWIGVLLLFYSFYPVCDEWVSVRFLLPGIPAVVIGFIVALRRAAALLEAHYGALLARLLAAGFVIAIVSFEVTTAFRLGFQQHVTRDAVFPETIAWAEPKLPGDAVVLCGLMSGPFLFYRNRTTIRWDEALVDGRLAVLRDSARKKHLHWYALLSVVEASPEQFNAWLPARWTPVGVNRDVTLWRLEE